MGVPLLIGLALGFVGIIGYVRATLGLLARMNLNDVLGRPGWTGCSGCVYEIYGSIVVALLGAAIAGVGA